MFLKHEQGQHAQKKPELGPLENGQTVIIVGGGPAGASCAIALKNIARESGTTIIRSKVKDVEIDDDAGGRRGGGFWP